MDANSLKMWKQRRRAGRRNARKKQKSKEYK
jgi:hypothetical protein